MIRDRCSANPRLPVWVILALTAGVIGLGWCINHIRTQANRQTAAQSLETPPAGDTGSLEDQIRELEASVEEKRQFLNLLVEGSPYSDPWHRAASEAHEQMQNARFQRDKIERRIDCFTRTEGLTKLEFAAGCDLPADEGAALISNYLQARLDLVALRASGLGSLHPRMIAQQEVIADLRQNFSENELTLLYQDYCLAKQDLIALRASGLGDQHPRVIAQGRIASDLKARCDRAVIELEASLKTLLLEMNNRLGEAEELHQEKLAAIAALPPDHFDLRRAADDFTRARIQLERLRDQMAASKTRD